MLIVLHGDNQAASRQALVEALETAKNHSQTIRLDAKNLTRAELEQALGSTSLFGDQQTVVVEGLHSLPKSKKLTELVALISSRAADTDIILWDHRALTKTMLKPWEKAGGQVKEFKISKALFKWLDSLTGQPTHSHQAAGLKLLHQAIAQESDWLCLTMLIYRVRQLITVSDGGNLKGAPFMISKLSKQAKSFSLPQLLQLHQKLYRLDKSYKTSSAVTDLSTSLDLLLLER